MKANEQLLHEMMQTLNTRIRALEGRYLVDIDNENNAYEIIEAQGNAEDTPEGYLKAKFYPELSLTCQSPSYLYGGEKTHTFILSGVYFIGNRFTPTEIADPYGTLNPYTNNQDFINIINKLKNRKVSISDIKVKRPGEEVSLNGQSIWVNNGILNEDRTLMLGPERYIVFTKLYFLS